MSMPHRRPRLDSLLQWTTLGLLLLVFSAAFLTALGLAILGQDWVPAVLAAALACGSGVLLLHHLGRNT